MVKIDSGAEQPPHEEPNRRFPVAPPLNVVEGLLLETTFECEGDNYAPNGSRVLSPGSVSGLDGQQIHQVANLCRNGSVLLNFYSPPFQV